MNCPNCGVPLMRGMTTCPKCKYDTKQPDGGEKYKEWNYKQAHKEDMEAQRRAKKEDMETQRRAEQVAQAIESVKRFSGSRFGNPDIIYHIDGARGRSIDIYPYKCVISTGVSIGSVLTRNATDGSKTIYYQDCVGLQVKSPGLTVGFIQFETASSTQNNFANNFFNENTFTYEPTQITAEEMSIVVSYITEQFDKIKEAQRLSWIKT